MRKHIKALLMLLVCRALLPWGVVHFFFGVFRLKEA
jgi:hypothetical protein